MHGAALLSNLKGMRWLSSESMGLGAVGTSSRMSARAAMRRSCTAACCGGACHVLPGTGASSRGLGGIKQKTSRRRQKRTMLPFATSSLTTHSSKAFRTSCNAMTNSERVDKIGLLIQHSRAGRFSDVKQAGPSILTELIYLPADPHRDAHQLSHKHAVLILAYV